MPRRNQRIPSPEYLGDYIWASLWSTGDIVARAINAISFFGASLILIIALIFKADPASLAIAFIVAVVLVILTHYGSFVAYQVERRERERLEDYARPQLQIECKQERGISLGGLQESRSSLAYLVVRNIKGGQVRNAYVKVSEIFEHAPAEGGGNAFRAQLYKHKDVFLRWEVTEDRLHSFATTAKVRVAYGRNGDGRYGLITIGPVTPTHALRPLETYELLIEIAAEEIPVFQQRLFLRMEEPQTTDEDGATTVWIDSPLKVEFREWTKADQPDPEMDLDEWQEAHLK